MNLKPRMSPLEIKVITITRGDSIVIYYISERG